MIERMFLPEEIIKAKRDGERLGDAALLEFANGIADGTVSDAQIGAFTMAVYFRGMGMAEQAALTLAMRDTGRCLNWTGLAGPVLDKHSSGGVGDLVSIVLAPLIAACGAYVPMISGQGLGHTGGTLDKLEAIPGFNVHPDARLFQHTVRETGLAITGQGSDLAPADGRMYAVRDVTATVSSVPLIVASILSKKLAEGLDGLVLDIKTGNGAFMSERDAAKKLASNLIEVAALAGLPARALITDMNQPLASSAGNALEIVEAINLLRAGTGNARLLEVTLSLGRELLLLGGLAESSDQAQVALKDALDSGRAAERLARMVSMLGGPADLLDKPGVYLQRAPVVRPCKAGTEGWIECIDTRAVGMCVVQLGGGRARSGDRIDPRVGLSELGAVGTRVGPGDTLALIHAANEKDWRVADDLLRRAITIGRKTDILPAVYERFA